MKMNEFNPKYFWWILIPFKMYEKQNFCFDSTKLYNFLSCIKTHFLLLLLNWFGALNLQFTFAFMSHYKIPHKKCFSNYDFLTCGKICKANINKCKRHNEA